MSSSDAADEKKAGDEVLRDGVRSSNGTDEREAGNDMPQPS